MKETQSLAGIGICYTELTSSAANHATNSAMGKNCVSLATRAMDRDSFRQAKSPQAPSPPLETPMQDRPTKTTPDLFTPINIGPLALPNRIAMAPLTRSRAAEGNVPTALNALYYAQRASAGLIISEATQVAPEGQGYISTPGIHSAEQIKGWQCVTGAVHASGGRIVLQLWHVGRISHQSFQPGGKLPVAPVGHQAERTGLHRQRLRADPNPARARARRDSRHRRAICARRAQRDGSRLRRRRGAWRERLSDRSVPARRHQQAHRRLWRLASRTARASCWKWSMP